MVQVTIWLDKACINQGDIEASLRALPVYLAGCKQLLVLAGPTYAQRLWCVLECFTFLRMGASIRRVHVIPLGDADDAAVEERFARFRAQDATCLFTGPHRASPLGALLTLRGLCVCRRCFKPEEKQRLLGVIEAGYGDFEDFNKLVKHMLIVRKQEVVTSAKKGRRASRFSISLSSKSAVRWKRAAVPVRWGAAARSSRSIAPARADVQTDADRSVSIDIAGPGPGEP